MPEDELERIRRDREDAKKLLYDLLLAPWNRMSPWAISNTCAYLEHPRRPATLTKTQEEQPCICGRMR